MSRRQKLLEVDALVYSPNTEHSAQPFGDTVMHACARRAQAHRVYGGRPSTVPLVRADTWWALHGYTQPWTRLEHTSAPPLLVVTLGVPRSGDISLPIRKRSTCDISGNSRLSAAAAAAKLSAARACL